MIYENFAELLNAIVMQAVKDYRWAKRKIKRDPDCFPAKVMIEEVEHFFLIDYFASLTDLDGEWLLERIRDVYCN